jgi:hypothetical protein
MNEEKRKAFLDGLQLYYKYKHEYETKYTTQKKKLLSKIKGLSIKEKKRELSKIKKKCLNCGRPVGSLFSNPVTIKDESRHLTIMCGDRASPCSLNVDIDLGVVHLLPEDILIDEEELSGHKKQIIQNKNDLLFGYITAEEAVEKFDTIKEDMSSTMSLYELRMSFLLKVVANKEHEEKTKKIQEELYKNIESIKQLIKEYEATQSTQYTHDAVEIYINDMIPRFIELNKVAKDVGFCYKTNSSDQLMCFYRCVEFNPEEQTFQLIVKEYFTEEIEMDLSENGQSVVSMVVGQERNVSKKKEKKILFQTDALPDMNSPAEIVEDERLE